MLQRVALYVLMTVMLFACKQYHDTTARFNAYFLAKEKVLEIENTLFGSPVNDYNDVLQVLVPIDTNAAKAQEAAFEYVIEKASLPIQFHESSKWVDDCYLLIGKARLYKGDFLNAVLTFKYVNAHSDDKDTRHAALILLMRTFVETREYDNLMAMVEYLRKEKVPFSEENTRDYHLVMAHYFRQIERLEIAGQHLELAIPLVKQRKFLARLHYVLAQIYELQGKEEKAFENFSASLKYSPTYEMAFHASLERSGVTKISSEQDAQEAAKYYRKLLADEKNWEYQDRIYYEMGLFAYKQGEQFAAINYLNESVQTSSSNVVQKAYSYLRIGRIYYEDLLDFENAALYYDSAIRIMPQEIKLYKPTKEKAEILKEFAEQYGIVKAQERLMKLKDMDYAARQTFLEEEYEAEKEAILLRKENERLSEQKRKRTGTATASGATSQQDGGWYFYNPTAKVFGQTNFIRTWGNRPLEDNWRRISKEQTFDQAQQPVAGGGRNNQKKKDEPKEDIFAGVKPVAERLLEIPETESALLAVHKRLEKGLFELGKVYMFRLKELKNAASTLNRVYEEYPKGPFTPEALYLLYTLCQDAPFCVSAMYKQILIEHYPETFYAKILINPNYVEDSNVMNARAAALYRTSYEYFQQEFFHEADSVLSLAIVQFPENTMMDKMHLLKVLIEGKTTEDMGIYYDSLQEFIRVFAKSDLVNYAKNLISGLDQLGIRPKSLREGPPPPSQRL